MRGRHPACDRAGGSRPSRSLTPMATRASSPPRSRSSSGSSSQGTKPRSSGSKKTSILTRRSAALGRPAEPRPEAGGRTPARTPARRSRRRIGRSPGSVAAGRARSGSVSPTPSAGRPAGRHAAPAISIPALRRDGARAVPARLRDRGRRRVLVGAARRGRATSSGSASSSVIGTLATSPRSCCVADGLADAAPSRPQRPGRPPGGRLDARSCSACWA